MLTRETSAWRAQRSGHHSQPIPETLCLPFTSQVRVVMSRTLELPENADLWDVSVAPTIVMTQKGARASFQAKLRARGVEVVEFDFLTPEAVAEYCFDRGWLQVGRLQLCVP